PFIQISIYGRGNNAYRWAGEADVFEALDHFVNVENAVGRGRLIDQDRIVLRGFSMGGAGTWHLGLHWPDRWCVLGPGAGFTSTHGYIKNLPAKLPAHQEACLHIYDAVDYAENAFNVPIVAYSGANDPQMLAAVNIEKRLKTVGIPMTHIVAPDLEHKFPPEWQKKAEAFYAKHVSQGRPEYAPRVRFVTYTMRYPTCHWVEILGLDKHYERTLVDAERTDTGYVIKTTNVRGLHLTLPVGPPLELTVKIDDQTPTPSPGRPARGSPSRPAITFTGCAVTANGPPSCRSACSPSGPTSRRRLPACKGRSTMRSQTAFCACAAPARPGIPPSMRTRKP